MQFCVFRRPLYAKPDTRIPIRLPPAEGRLKTMEDTCQTAFAVRQARLKFVCRFQRDLL